MALHAALAPLLLALAAGDGKPNLDAYRYVELRDYVAQALVDHPDLLTRADGRDTITLHPVERLRFAAIAVGKVRPLAGFRKEALEKWIAHQAPFLAGHFKQEILVKAAGREHWMPVQESLVAAFGREVKPGATVGLYAAFIGSANEEFLFLVNEFRAL